MAKISIFPYEEIIRCHLFDVFLNAKILLDAASTKIQT